MKKIRDKNLTPISKEDIEHRMRTMSTLLDNVFPAMSFALIVAEQANEEGISNTHLLRNIDDLDVRKLIASVGVQLAKEADKEEEEEEEEWGDFDVKPVVRIKKLHPDAVLPTYATDGSACFDLYPVNVSEGTAFTGSQIFSTGLAVQIPEGYCMEIYSRSGHGFNHDVRLANCVGIIDSDYRGELKVKLTVDDSRPFIVHKDKAIAQAKLAQIEQAHFLVVDELTETERGEGGFGSTDKVQ